MNTLTATNARVNLFKLLKQTIKGHLHTRISSKEGNAILISEEDYESLLETAELLSISGFKESILQADKEIENGDVVSMDEAFN
jgi:antitoxin YefM